MHPLACKAQQYAWGKVGMESKVAQLQAATGEAVDKTAPYAELWMGTHPSGPSSLVGGGTLEAWLAANPTASGLPAGSGQLPYLFKVLSIAKALSVQAHPDKALAERLHAERPDVYKDGNHKPEMALAVTPCRAMCGFRAVGELVAHLETQPELRGLVGDAEAGAFTTHVESLAGGTPTDDTKAALRSLFSAYLRADEAAVGMATAAWTARMAATPADARSPAEALGFALCSQFPGDIGIFAPFFLNVIDLAPGEALFLCANEPHAYLSGDMVECMACSDNVVRAGLTPKLRDVDTLSAMLTYTTGAVKVYKGEPVGPHTWEYRPPIPEFVINAIDLPPSTPTKLEATTTASIVLVVRGGAASTSDTGTLVSLAEGTVHVQAADATMEVTSGPEGALMFRVHTNDSA